MGSWLSFRPYFVRLPALMKWRYGRPVGSRGKPRCPRCREVLPEGAGRGRPAVYCSPACRQSAYAKRKAKAPRSDWWTPEFLRERLRAEWNLGLDAAASRANTVVPGNWLGLDHPDPDRRDALAFEHWAGLVEPGQAVYVNPPYTPVPAMRPFLERALATAAAGVSTVALVKASVGTKWWDDLVQAPGVRHEFIRRLTYDGPYAVGDPAPWPSALLFYEAPAT